MVTPSDLHEVVDVIAAIVLADFFLPWAAARLLARWRARRKKGPAARD